MYYQKERRDDAFAAYEVALTANPFNYLAMNNVAYYYAEADTLLDKAEDYARRVVRHEPDNPTYLDTYAWVLYKKGDFEGAKEQIDRTINLTDLDVAMDSIDSEMNAIEQGDSNIIGEQPDDLVEEVTEVVEVEEPELVGSADLYDHAGDIYYRCGETAKAVEFWKKALERKPENPELIKDKIKHRKITDKNAQ